MSLGGDMTANELVIRIAAITLASDSAITLARFRPSNQKGRKGAGVKGAGVANCRIFRSAVPSVVVWSILLVSLSGVKKKL